MPALNKLRLEKQQASDYNQAKVELGELKRRVAEQTWARDQRCATSTLELIHLIAGEHLLLG